MVIDAPRFWEQVRLGEDSRLELKEVRFQDDPVSAPHRDGLADGFAAFANARGGRVVLGVTDDRKPQALTPAQLDLLAKRVTDSQVVHNTGINSLSPELWRRYASSRTNDPVEATLTKLKFVKDDRHGALRATVGGVVLAADDPREWLPNAYVQAVCYDGTRQDGNRQLDAQDIGGPLDRQIRDAMRFVVRNRRVALGSSRSAARFPNTTNERCSRPWSTRWCTGTTRCPGRRSACSCSTIAWSCTRRADSATP